MMLSDRDLLARLVAFDTTSSESNLPMADFVCEYVDDPRVRIARQLSPDGAKANLVIVRDPQRDAPEGAGLVLSGHMDTVPVEETGWTTDPFVLTERDAAYAARGACDMKGFLALALNAFRASPALDHPLALLFTFDEEVGTLGSRHFVAAWSGDPLPRSVVIGEPTELHAVRMHKGHLKLRLTTEGRAAHSGLPHLGVNAIEPAARAIAALASMRRAWEGRRGAFADAFGEVPFVALNVAQIRGGTAVNVVPDACAIDIGLRTLPGSDTDALVDEVRSAVAAALGDAPFTLETTGDSPPMDLAEDAWVHQTLCRITGHGGAAGAAFATDGGWLQRLGMECVLCGPGSMNAAHRPDEHVPVEQMRRGAEVVRAMIHAACHATDG